MLGACVWRRGHGPVSSPQVALGFRRAGAEMHARLLPPRSGAVLGEEGHRTTSLLREAPGRQDTGPGTCPPKGGGRAAGRMDRQTSVAGLAFPPSCWGTLLPVDDWSEPTAGCSDRGLRQLVSRG